VEKFITVVVFATGVFVLIALLSTIPIMLLWNWLMPDLFHLAQIDFWQALGLGVLSGLLFRTSKGSSDKK
jgi:hypothetical protein